MVRVVTDSTADLSPALARELGITVVPLYVHFGQEVFRDGVDMEAEEFYRRLTSSRLFPTTSAPSPGVFAEVYQRLGPDEVISIHISARLSGTYDAALTGSREVGGRVEVVDSRNLSLAMGLLCIAAARWGGEGRGLAEVASRVQAAIPRLGLFGILDTLEYLHKGGRIGRAQAFLGSLLNIKPLIGLKEGEVHPIERVRSRAKAISRICELVQGFGDLEALGVLYSTTPQEAEELAARLRPLAPGGAIYRGRFGPVLGCHIGPGALGVAVLGKGQG